MKKLFLITFTTLVCCLVSYSAPPIDRIDRIRIAEALRLADSIQDRVWPGWSSAPFALLFITDEHEYLIHHPKPNSEFVSLGYDRLLKSEVYVRNRVFQTNFLATFPAFGQTPVVVVGKAENTSEKTSTRWVTVLLHEHFHQLQYSEPKYFDDVAALDLAGDDRSGMWQINYPFPYTTEELGRRFRDLGALLLRAYTARSEESRNNALASFLSTRKAFATSLSQNDRKYMAFQLWQEGIARYTQYRVAKLAATRYKPSKAFRSLPDYVPFSREADRLMDTMLGEIRNLDLAKSGRTVFYPFGAVEGLLLDRVAPKWHRRYFREKFALESFYPTMKKDTSR